ncbi:MAG: TIGR00282 family metallophosphoesterase [Planctomycetota bacterium]|nr:TIGR00282 family metallophosphoesterase [Planctomycetota bacterium]
MRILLIGDIVGKPGRRIVRQAISGLVERERIDLVIANAENSAAGSGITPANYEELMAAGIDAITLGDHIYRRREIYRILETKDNIVKPANYPPEAPGKEFAVVTSAGGDKVAIISLIGRVFMKPADCPFAAVDRVLRNLDKTIKVIVVDVHAEATSDKQALGRYLDGRVSAVLGTHTHVPTADECLLPGGTAFQCDVGMTGPYDSILGRRADRVIETTRTFMPLAFDVASNDVRLGGTIVDIDAATGKATDIRRICVTEEQATALSQSDSAPR